MSSTKPKVPTDKPSKPLETPQIKSTTAPKDDGYIQPAIVADFNEFADSSEPTYTWSLPGPKSHIERSESPKKENLRKAHAQVSLNANSDDEVSRTELNTQGLKVEKVIIIPMRKLIKNAEESE